MRFMTGDIVFSSYFDRICVVDYIVGRTVFLMTSEYCIDAIGNSRDYLTFLERPLRKLLGKEPVIQESRITKTWIISLLLFPKQLFVINSVRWGKKGRYATKMQAVTAWNKMVEDIGK